MKKYEIMYIVTAKLSKEDLIKEVEKNNTFLEKNKVKIEQSNISEPKEFAYLIKKQSKGYYVVLNVTVENHNQLVEFEQNLKFNSNILRYIIIKDEFYKNNKNKNKEDKIKVEKKEQGEKHD